MIHHLVVFSFRDDASPEAIATLEAALLTLPSLIPQVRSFRIVHDLGLREGNADMAVLASFDDREAYMAYATNEDHQAVIRDHVRPILAARSALQYEG